MIILEKNMKNGLVLLIETNCTINFTLKEIFFWTHFCICFYSSQLHVYLMHLETLDRNLNSRHIEVLDIMAIFENICNKICRMFVFDQSKEKIFRNLS